MKGPDDAVAMPPPPPPAEPTPQAEDPPAPSSSPPSASSSSADSTTAAAAPASEEEAAEPVRKKTRRLEFEEAYLRAIPSAEAYEKSFMHRDVVSHVAATSTDFILTASADGHLKFWKKEHRGGIEFVKHFRAHLGPISDLSVSANGSLAASLSHADKSAKIFDVPNFDMINMLKLGFAPRVCAWVHQPADPIAALAVSDRDSPLIRVYDGKGSSEPIHCFERLHSKPVVAMAYSTGVEAAISADEAGMLEYWSGPRRDYAFPEHSTSFQSKLDTDLYTFFRLKKAPTALAFSPDGELFASLTPDRQIRLFAFRSGKLKKVVDESLTSLAGEKDTAGLINVEFNRRLALEKELDRQALAFGLQKLVFDESGHFLLYPTALGIKVLNLKTNQVHRRIGRPENMRLLGVGLCAAVPSSGRGGSGSGSATEGGKGLTAEMVASDNPALRTPDPDPLVVACAYKSHRFFLFTNTEPFGGAGEESERDVFNEKPQKEDIIAAVETKSGESKLADAATIHTTFGDVHFKLFGREAPKAVENFCTHSRRGYYNGHIFHRVIKSFMIQTGDPTGKGHGGESIWGKEFEDEISPNLKHDVPYTLSMANAGPNTNSSQFFITVVPTPWLDGKHTIFGRVTSGMDTVMKISQVRTSNRTQKPKDEIRIVSITLK